METLWGLESDHEEGKPWDYSTMGNILRVSSILHSNSRHADSSPSSASSGSSSCTSLVGLEPVTGIPSPATAVCILPFLSLFNLRSSKNYLRFLLGPEKRIFQVKTKVRAYKKVLRKRAVYCTGLYSSVNIWLFGPNLSSCFLRNSSQYF